VNNFQTIGGERFEETISNVNNRNKYKYIDDKKLKKFYAVCRHVPGRYGDKWKALNHCEMFVGERKTQ
jgi:hypothetical protein